MDQELKTYLAARILNDGELVSYRSLSRYLKVHNNIAKQLLHEFYLQQRARKPGSVHATYLVSGTKASDNEASVNNGGVQDHLREFNIRSSPFMSSPVQRADDSVEQLPLKVVTLVREQDLEVVKAEYQQISSIHIYSLGPKSIQILSDCNREITEEVARDEPLHDGKLYGTVQNLFVKRRTGQFPTLEPSSIDRSNQEHIRKSLDAGESTSETAENPDDKSTAKAKNGVDVTTDVKPHLSGKGEKKASNKVRGVKREQSDIFKSFSKPRRKPSTKDTETPAILSSNVPVLLSQEGVSVHEDEPMMDVPESEHEEVFIEEAKLSTSGATKSKSEQEEQLLQMMEGEEGEFSATRLVAGANRIEDETMVDKAEDGSQESGPSDQIELPREPSTEPQSLISGGRRRGKRKTMKKKTFKDEEGYLVTKEEVAWESFSEDEPISQTEKTPSSGAVFASKGKKAGGLGQGNIMSFFGKK